MTKMPNFLFVIADQHRWDFLGWRSENGKTLTPNLEKIAADGVIFDNAFCNAPLCSPSRAAIASGRYGMNSGSFTNLHELPSGTPSFVAQLRNAGYETAAVGKTHMEIHAYDSDLTTEKHRQYMVSLGWDYIREVSGNGMLKTGIKCAYTEFLKDEGVFGDVLEYYRRWQYFMDKRPGFPDFHSEPWPLEEKYQETPFIADKALEFLETRNNSKPFFLHVGFAGPHSPIEPDPRFLEMYDNLEETLPCGGEASDDLLKARKGYRAMITQIDSYIGRIIEALEKSGELDNTIIVYTADHGEMAGDFGRAGKTCFYDGSVRVPFIVSGAGKEKNFRSDALVESIDIGKTLCELAGVEPHFYDQGRSVVPLLSGEASTHRDSVYSEMGCDKMLFDGRYKLMLGDSGSDERELGRLHLDKPVNIPPSPVRLYDLQEDPRELDDLSSKPQFKELLQNMKEKLLLRLYENSQTLEPKSRGEYKPL
jgi:choline-sulfatase